MITPVGPAPVRPGLGGGGFGGARMDGPMPRMGGFQSFKHGGRVKKTGLAKVERGERVLTKKQQHAKSMHKGK